MHRCERIIVDPYILVGKPALKGTGLPGVLPPDRLTDGWSVDDLLTAYPRLMPEDVQAVFVFPRHGR